MDIDVYVCLHVYMGMFFFPFTFTTFILRATMFLYRVLHMTMGARAMCAYIRAYGTAGTDVSLPLLCTLSPLFPPRSTSGSISLSLSFFYCLPSATE
jgi:hypothetical protein